ncbi:hypothetical protein ON010_g15443 [Phytophthora cinnamomi]|nr:hypothetical protein ON010_g15443 [Phytophthora cinnamomi]
MWVYSTGSNIRATVSFGLVERILRFRTAVRLGASPRSGRKNEEKDWSGLTLQHYEDLNLAKLTYYNQIPEFAVPNENIKLSANNPFWRRSIVLSHHSGRTTVIPNSGNRNSWPRIQDRRAKPNRTLDRQTHGTPATERSTAKPSGSTPVAAERSSAASTTGELRYNTSMDSDRSGSRPMDPRHKRSGCKYSQLSTSALEPMSNAVVADASARVTSNPTHGDPNDPGNMANRDARDGRASLNLPVYVGCPSRQPAMRHLNYTYLFVQGAAIKNISSSRYLKNFISTADTEMTETGPAENATFVGLSQVV